MYTGLRIVTGFLTANIINVNTANKTIIRHHSFNEMLALCGESQYADGFHIIEQKEDMEEKCPHYPFRSDHFSILIVNGGESQVRLNMTEYNLRANQVLIIPPNAIRQFVGASPGFKCTGAC